MPSTWRPCTRPVSAVADHTEHRDPEGAFETLQVESSTPGVEYVDHRHDQTGGGFPCEQLTEHEEGAFEGARVGHHDERVGCGAKRAIENPADHLLVRAHGGEAVGAGQIHAHDVAPVELAGAFAAFDRYARIVADPRVQSGECIEKGGLARIGASDQPQAERARKGCRIRAHDRTRGCIPGPRRARY